MSFLIITTIIWSLSFSLIGRNLSTYIDPWSLGLIRTALSVLLFLPFINFKIKLKRIFVYVSIGFVQLGMMYFFYLNAFTYTSIPKIMLFTIFTPLYVTLFSSLIYKEFQKSFFLATFLAIFGGLILRYTIINSTDLTGFILIQLSNICFATGQVFYQYYFKLKKTNKSEPKAPISESSIVRRSVLSCLFTDLLSMLQACDFVDFRVAFMIFL